jgi:anti-sigma factor RsiW
MNKRIRKLLYKSFDHELSLEEQQSLDEALAASRELREEKARIESMRDTVSAAAADSFGASFAERVMQRIETEKRNASRSEIFFESLVRVFRPVAAAAMIVLIAMAVYNMSVNDSVSLTGALGQPDVTLDQVLDPATALAME